MWDQAAHPFLWSFYIGHAGKGWGSIIADCAQENVVFSIQSGRGKWQNISTLVVLPRTTIRVSYLDSRGAATQEELVFPSDPREAPITSHYLQLRVALRSPDRFSNSAKIHPVNFHGQTEERVSETHVKLYRHRFEPRLHRLCPGVSVWRERKAK
ncbi:hypothetical protein B0H14DRAFT_2599949 [Mycena olivaceomarginata]|nr:hypothetical protein B0H14DRAFT_2599949 [Mycena olivaceomarginata]